MYEIEDTIVAVASPPGAAARGIVRLSGGQTAACVTGVFLPVASENDGGRFDVERPCVLEGVLHLEAFHSPIPADVYLWPNRRSYTGQPVAEFHTVGSPPVLEALVRELCAAGARPAEPGEFTLRAFLSGRIDLIQAEAVLGTIDATNRTQLDTALAQLAGGLSRPLAALRDALLDVSAHLEAGLDFADEDIAFITPEELRAEIQTCADAIERLNEQLGTRHEAVHLPRVVLSGPPNAGKSSLFNALVGSTGALAGNTGALVSRVPGTTRDYLTATLSLGDVDCWLVDTAGTHEAAGDAIDAAAQSQMEAQCRAASVVLLCVDSTRPTAPDAVASSEASADRRIVVLTKCDRSREAAFAWNAKLPVVRTSSKTGEGVRVLEGVIRDEILAQTQGSEGLVVTTAVRCRESLRLTAESLRRALEHLDAAFMHEELVAADLQIALEEIGKIVGVIYTDDLLDRVFSRFCIGK